MTNILAPDMSIDNTLNSPPQTALQECKQCHRRCDVQDFQGVNNKISDLCGDCREYRRMYQICNKSGDDWEQWKQEFGLLSPSEHICDQYPAHAIPCSGCSNLLPVEAFNRDHNKDPNKDRRRGCRYECKSCIAKYRERTKKYKKETMKCSYCSSNIQRNWMYQHLKICKSNPEREINRIVCHICNIPCSTPTTFKRHLLSEGHKKLEASLMSPKISVAHDPEEIKRMLTRLKDSGLEQAQQFICFPCCTKLDNEIELGQHMNTCQKTLGNICLGCGEISRGTWDNKRHILTKHFSTNITCPICSQNISVRKWKEKHAKACLTSLLRKEYPGKSRYEKWTSKFLTSYKIPFIREKTYDDLQDKIPLPYDFYLPDRDTLIEIHGKQHYEKMNRSNADAKFEETQAHDTQKIKYAQENNIDLVTIDCRPVDSYEDIAKILADKLQISLDPAMCQSEFYLDEQILDEFGDLLGLKKEDLKAKRITPQIMLKPPSQIEPMNGADNPTSPPSPMAALLPKAPLIIPKITMLPPTPPVPPAPPAPRIIGPPTLEETQRRTKIATTLHNYNQTPEGQVNKIQAHSKRSATMEVIKTQYRDDLNVIGNKICNHCKKTQPLSLFGNKKAAKDGLQTNCKDCVRELKRQWRAKQKATGVTFTCKCGASYDLKDSLTRHRKESNH